MLNNLEIYQFLTWYTITECTRNFVKINSIFYHMEDNTKLQPKELNITFAKLNQIVN